jgi:MFS family permease
MNVFRGRQAASVLDAPPATASSASPPPAGDVIASPAAVIAAESHGRGFSFRNLRTFSSLKVRVFRLYYASMLAQMAAMNMEMIARGLLVYRMTGSGTILGVMALANSMPMLVFSLGGGVLADRVHKKYLMVFGQAANAVLALFIAVALTVGWIAADSSGGVWILIVASLFKGSVQGVMMPARQSMIPDLVGRDQIMNAMALNNLGMNLLRLLAPALAGFAVAFWGFGAVYYIMTGLFVAATLFAIPLPKTAGLQFRQSTRAVADLVGGFRYVIEQKTIGLILIFTLFVVLLSMPYMMLLPVFTEDILNVGAEGMGILISVSGIGAIAGSLVLASLPNRYRGLMLILSSLLLGVALTVFAFSTAWAVSLVAIIFVGLGQTGRMTLAGSLLQHYVEDAFRGRVMSIYMMEFGLTSLSVLVAGVLSDTIGIQWAIGSLALLLVVLSVMVLLMSPKLRALD